MSRFGQQRPVILDSWNSPLAAFGLLKKSLPEWVRMWLEPEAVVPGKKLSGTR